MKKTQTNLDLNVELPYSHGLLLKYGLIKNRINAPAVMHAMHRVARHPRVAKKRAKLIPLETILQEMTARQLTALRKSAAR